MNTTRTNGQPEIEVTTRQQKGKNDNKIFSNNTDLLLLKSKCSCLKDLPKRYVSKCNYFSYA